MSEKYFSTPEVAKILGISRIAVFKRIKSGSLLAIKIGKSYLIEKAQVFELYKKKFGRDAEKQVAQKEVTDPSDKIHS